MAKLPVFTTERLILREVTESDAPAYEKNFVDYEIIGQLGSVVPRRENSLILHIRSAKFGN